jgi:hypothetical protein
MNSNLTLQNIHAYIITGIANGKLNWSETITEEGLQNLLDLNWGLVNPTEGQGNK